MKKELLSTIILLLICILLLLGCKSEDIDNREKNTEGSTDELIKNNTTDSREAYLKDMACNTLNGGAVTYDDEKIYYVLDESLWSMNKDGSSQEKLCQRNAENIWSDGENVYFLYEKKLYAVNKETKEEKLMFDKEMSTFFITEDKLYYVSENVLYVSSLSNTDAFQCIDKFAFMPVTDGQNIYYNYGTGIKVIGLKDMEEKIYRGSCRMNPYILGDYLYVSEEYDEAFDYRINIKKDVISNDDWEEYEIPSTNIVMYDNCIYGIDGKMDMNTKQWTKYEEKEIEQVYIAGDRLIYVVKDHNSNSGVMKMLCLSNGTDIIVGEEQNGAETVSNETISEEEWQESYYLDMAGNTFVTYDTEKIYYEFDDKLWSVNRDGTEVKKLYDSIGKNGKIWSVESEIYLDDMDCIAVIDKVTGQEKERLYVGGGEAVIQAFGMTSHNIYFNVVGGRVYAFNIDTKNYSSPIADNYPASMLITDGKHIFYNNDDSRKLCMQNMDGSEYKEFDIIGDYKWVDVIGNYLYFNESNGYARNRISLDNPESVEDCNMPLGCVEYNGYTYGEHGKISMETNQWEPIDTMKIKEINKSLDKAVYKAYDEENDKYVLKLLNLKDGTIIVLWE